MLLPVLWMLSVSVTIAPPAAEGDAGELLRRCQAYPAKTPEEKYLLGYCMGFIQGVADMVLDAEPGSWHICIPKKATSGDIMDAVVAYLRSRPNELEYSASSTIIAALQNKHPCGPTV